MTTNKKITKKNYITTLQEIVNFAENQGVGLPEDMTFEGINEYLTNELKLLEKKAEAAAKRAADKKTAGDTLREKVLSVLTPENQTLANIVAALGDSNVTQQMITPRLSQLVEFGQAVRDQVSVPGVDGGKTRKVAAYRLA